MRTLIDRENSTQKQRNLCIDFSRQYPILKGIHRISDKEALKCVRMKEK